MNEEKIDFFDEKGELIPLPQLQEKLNKVYNKILEDHTKEEHGSILECFTDPQCQINNDDVINTFSFFDRAFYLCDEITHDSAIEFCEGIKFWNTIDEIDKIPVEERDPIKIYINSPGGDLDATFSIIDSIQMSKTPVWTVTISSGYSGGFFVGIAGHKRYGYPHSSYLFHEGSIQYGSDSHKYLQQVEFYKKQLEMLKDLTIQKTKITESEYEKHTKDDLWLTAAEALEKGIIDEITTELV